MESHRKVNDFFGKFISPIFPMKIARLNSSVNPLLFYLSFRVFIILLSEYFRISDGTYSRDKHKPY